MCSGAVGTLGRWTQVCVVCADRRLQLPPVRIQCPEQNSQVQERQRAMTQPGSGLSFPSGPAQDHSHSQSTPFLGGRGELGKYQKGPRGWGALCSHESHTEDGDKGGEGRGRRGDQGEGEVLTVSCMGWLRGFSRAAMLLGMSGGWES